MIRFSAICFLILFSAVTVFAQDPAWPPTAPAGWTQMGVTDPTKATGCSGDLSLWPEMKAICEGTANKVWTAMFIKFDLKTGATTNVNMTLFKDGSEQTYYFYCGPKLYLGFDPSAGFQQISPGSVSSRTQSCFQ